MATIRVRERVESSMYERSFLPEIIRGVIVTTSHLFQNMLGRRKTRPMATVRYPEERRVYPFRFRGHHRLMSRPDGSPRCVACGLCATVCPANCIHIVAAESPHSTIEKVAAIYELDQLRCINCGLCVEACPQDAIRMDTGCHATPFTKRSVAVKSKETLLAQAGQPGAASPYGAYEKRLGKTDTPTKMDRSD